MGTPIGKRADDALQHFSVHGIRAGIIKHLHIHAILEGKSLSELLTEIFESYLKEKEKKKRQ